MECHWEAIAKKLAVDVWPEEGGSKRCCVTQRAVWNGRSIVRGDFLDILIDLRNQEMVHRRLYYSKECYTKVRTKSEKVKIMDTSYRDVGCDNS